MSVLAEKYQQKFNKIFPTSAGCVENMRLCLDEYRRELHTQHSQYRNEEVSDVIFKMALKYGVDDLQEIETMYIDLMEMCDDFEDKREKTRTI